ncbi:MAG: SoxR reducing system RseC family protein [Candidatus Sabulitectum sp.]|nr:SoxR reducing system RseC family protein [Candidatus Sabulitectum sp.]
MIQRGVVRELVDGHAKIAVGGGEGCSVCASRESCLSITGSRPEEKIITTENVLGVSVGDVVELELPVSVTMQIIGLTFMVPVALLIAGYWIMMPAGSTQGAIGAVSGLAVGMLIALSVNRTLGKRASYRMRMTRILAKCSEEEVTK